MEPTKILLVTGGGTGIGAATCVMAAEQGYDVCVNYRSSSAGAEAVAAQVRAAGRRAIAVQADISIEADVSRLFQTADRELGRLTHLVNNAGILERQTRVEDVTAERLARILATNVTGAFLCCREAVRRMSTKHGGGGGVIVNVSSAAARLGSAGEYVDYAASKGAMDTLTIGLANEVAAEGIRVNAVRPAFIETEIHARGGEPGRIERLKPAIPLRRGGTVDEVAEAILWLLSERASYTTGGFIDVAGGK